MNKLTHINKSGEAQMVDISDKNNSHRQAKASALIHMQKQTLKLIISGAHKKGDVLAVARIAAIQAAKKCWEIIPLCHPLMLSQITIKFKPNIEKSLIEITSCAKVEGKTGVEMEALLAVNIAALTIYDMCKAVDRFMRIENLQLLEKKGGKSGHWKIDK